MEVWVETQVISKLNIIGNAPIKTIEEIFYNINEHILETKYIMGLGQLLKITPYPKWYLWKKRKPVTNTMMPKLVIENTHIATNGVVMETCLVAMAIDNHMVVIQI
jgi:hypothetical protein